MIHICIYIYIKFFIVRNSIYIYYKKFVYTIQSLRIAKIRSFSIIVSLRIRTNLQRKFKKISLHVSYYTIYNIQ